MAEPESNSDSALTDQSENADVYVQSEDESSANEFETNTFSTKSPESDLALVVEERKLYVSKPVLAIASPVFKNMFSGKFRETNSDELPLPEKKHDAVVEFLRYVYPNIRKKVTLQNVSSLLPLADEYQVRTLKSDCVSFLMEYLSDGTPADQLYNILMQASLYHLDEVKEKCLKLAADRPNTELNDIGPDILTEDMKSIIRIKMLDNLERKYKNASKQVNTSKVLSKFLGASAKLTSLASQYEQGRVVGNYKAIQISPYRKHDVKLNVDGNTFKCTVEFQTHTKRLTVECTNEGEFEFTTFGAVVVNNMMDGQNDLINVSARKHDFDYTVYTDEEVRILPDIYVTEKDRFIREGKFHIDIYIFIIKDVE